MFTVSIDEKAGILHLKLIGFWTPDTVRDFAAALIPAVERLRRRHPSYSVLSDSTEFPVQSPEVGEGFERLMAGGASRTGGRTAIIVASMLNKFQAQRVFRAPNIRIFLDRDEALAWLAEAPSAAA